MRSYCEIIKELSKKVNSDNLVNTDRTRVVDLINQLLDILVQYDF
jgi:hypothetical protein